MKTGVKKSLQIRNGCKEKWKQVFRWSGRGCLAGGVCLAGMVYAAGCGGKAERYTALDTAMGTVIQQTVYTRDDDITAAVEEIIESLEAKELSWRLSESEIAKINASVGDGAVAVSDKLYEDLTILLEVSQRSDGAFDFTVGSVVRLWNIDTWAAGDNSDVCIPEAGEIAEQLSYAGYGKVQLENGSISLPAGMSLDLGAAGKGLACDRIAAFLEEEEVCGAVISVGGSILTYGKKPDDTPWQVSIVNPLDTSAVIGTLSLEGQWFVSTSGDYERYIVVDGVRYHHILDPATGYPADSGVSSVTILCKSGMLGDALSTACFVLGEEKGMELAKSYGAEALFVDREGSITMTEGMKDIFKGTGED